MRFTVLGNTDVKVSQLCIGTMTFGEQNTEAESHAQLDRAVTAGINFIDTAEMYPVPAKAETVGATESIIGNWLKQRGGRDKLIVATKVVGRSNWLPYIRQGNAGLDQSNIASALESSLKRLRTDYVDLYQLHWPDRISNFFGKLGYQHSGEESTPLAESLSALDRLVKAGKIRHIGLSNETPWGVMSCLQLSDKNGWPRVVSIQNPYSLLNRSFEVGLAEIAHREKVGLLAYSPLAFGTLSGKYLDSKSQNKNGRLTLFPQFSRYTNPQGVSATRAYVNLANSFGLSPSQMALAYVNSRSFLTANVIGATTLRQLDENIESLDVKLSGEIIDEIEVLHQQYSNPCP